MDVCKWLSIIGSFFFLAFPLKAGNHFPRNFNSHQQSVTANHDYINMIENTTWTISVINNDYGLSEGISSLEIITPPQHGTAVVLEDNDIQYTPNEGFIGKDQLKYRICNTYNECDEAIVYINVEDYDFIPEAINDEVTFYSDSNLVFDVLTNDKYLFDKPLQLKIIQDLNYGFATVTEDLKIKVEITSYFLETDSLIYQVCDKEGDCDQALMYLKLSSESSGLIIPEAFSPNGDGFNDYFRIPAFDYYENRSISVFNRNGILVFESKNYNNKWDGFGNQGPVKGKKVPPGIYYYIIKIGNNHQQFKGSIYISY
ncbi:gliding motility-associated C-terminal domain-containing protein [Thermophagus xiamenensis]|uniref:Gliding motility-associated C-terminal domain-containing protein n=1 Tax=Thermophagus xiamenensis TaxID=385682 RepID=A0A1I1WZS1_9BACT|nr:gliding motility-associated C-terminal domain-containing protein [Thermophagus xiamenensis]SFE00481.1 gliding motility-associated C-terminal domain-containing protein [Thermophagus xiamenensis]